jgi:hypothetical protein
MKIGNAVAFRELPHTKSLGLEGVRFASEGDHDARAVGDTSCLIAVCRVNELCCGVHPGLPVYKQKRPDDTPQGETCRAGERQRGVDPARLGRSARFRERFEPRTSLLPATCFIQGSSRSLGGCAASCGSLWRRSMWRSLSLFPLGPRSRK